MTSTDSMDVDELRLQASDFEVVLGHVVGAFVTLSVIARSRVEQGLSYRRIKEALDYICIAVSWITCYIEMLYLDIEDKIYYQHRLHRFNEPTMRSINNIEDDNQSESMFGFKRNELVMLYQHWRLPQEFLVQNRRFSSEEAMLLFLFYIRSGMAFTRMTTIFGGDPRVFTYYIRAITDHLYHNFYHKLSGDSMRQWVPHITQFRGAIWDKLLDGLVNESTEDGNTDDNWEVWVPFATFRIFGWLDDTDMATNHPRPAWIIHNNQQNEVRDTQQAFYK